MDGCRHVPWINHREAANGLPQLDAYKLLNASRTSKHPASYGILCFIFLLMRNTLSIQRYQQAAAAADVTPDLQAGGHSDSDTTAVFVNPTQTDRLYRMPRERKSLCGVECVMQPC